MNYTEYYNSFISFNGFSNTVLVPIDNVNSATIINNSTFGYLDIGQNGLLLSPGEKVVISGKDLELYIGKIIINLIGFPKFNIQSGMIIILKRYINAIL